MIPIFKTWYIRHFSDPQAVILAFLLILTLSVILFFGEILAPLIAAIVIAYILDGAVEKLRIIKLPRLVAVIIVFLVFVGFIVMSFVGLIPLMYQQVVQMFSELPGMLAKGQQLLLTLPVEYPNLFTEQQVLEIMNTVRSEVAVFGQQVLSVSLSSVVSVITIMVYLILVPFLVFFFLKDKTAILDYAQSFLPHERKLTNDVWREVNGKIGNYVRGKIVEILITWAASFIAFAILGLHYAMLLSFLVGISVIIPYVGAAVVTVPIALIAYFQWGFGNEFMYVMIAYTVIQFLDGNVLIPILFSEVVNLHPVAIIAAVLFFGGLWGLWGVFFAIPLATVVQSVINTWPNTPIEEIRE